MSFWIGAVGLTFGSLALILLPLVRRSPATRPERFELSIELCRDQLAQVERDLAETRIGRQEADALRTEIKRRMLAALRAAEDASEPARAQERRESIAVVLALAVPAAAFALYLALGAPGEPDQPLTARLHARELAAGQLTPDERREIERAVAVMSARLAADPADARGWHMLGRAYGALGNSEDAIAAYRRAFALAPQQPGLAAEFGEALVVAADGRVDDEARAAFEEGIAADINEPRSRYYLALRKAQDGDLASALSGWQAMIADAPANAPWLEQARAQAARAAAALGSQDNDASPSAKEVSPPDQVADPSGAERERIAALPPVEREAAIRAMVERLAARLAEHPNDREGWLRLARAYDVLGQRDKADEARAHARRLDSGS